MSFRPFTSESYAQRDRLDAWRDVLGAVGLEPGSAYASDDGHAIASHRHTAELGLTRIAAGPQSITALPQSHEVLPIALMPTEDGAVLRCRGQHRIIPVGHLLLLPRNRDWSLVFQR